MWSDKCKSAQWLASGSLAAGRYSVITLDTGQQQCPCLLRNYPDSQNQQQTSTLALIISTNLTHLTTLGTTVLYSKAHVQTWEVMWRISLKHPAHFVDPNKASTKTARNCQQIFKNDPFQNQTDLVSPIEMGARILLQEMEIWLDVDGRPNNPPEDSKLNDRRLVDNTFQKLSLMENLSNETLDLVKGVGTLLIKKLAEQPGPVTKPTEGRIEKFIYFILQMLSRNPHFPENVMTNLQKIGMWLTY